MDAELTLRFADTSLDPYVRFFEPRLSPFTTAVAGGTIRVVGELADIDHLVVETRVEQLDLKLFDYRAAQRRARSSWRSISTSLEIEQLPPGRRGHRSCSSAARSSCTTTTIASQASGDANLGILQGFYPRPPQPRHGRAQGADRRPARQAGVLRQRRRSPTAASATSVAAALARGDQRPVSFDASGVRIDDVDGAARRRRRHVRRPHRPQRLHARRPQPDGHRRADAPALSRRASARSSTPT